MKWMQCALLLVIMIGVTAQAAESISLSNGDIARLGIGFAAVSPLNSRFGNSFAGRVINSPNVTSTAISRYQGILEQWLVRPGEQVEKGQVLALIRSTEVLSLHSRFLVAKNRLQQTAFKLSNDETLLHQGIISASRLQASRSEHQLAAIDLATIEEQLNWAGYGKGTLSETEQNNLRSGDYFLLAPVAGILTHRVINVGAHVSANNEVASIQEEGNMWLMAKVPASAVTTLPIGHQLTIKGTNEMLVLRQKDFEVDATTQTVQLYAEFSQTVSYLAGQALTLLLPPDQPGILIPQSAVVHNGDDTTIYVRTADGVQARTIQLEAVGPDYFATQGIQAGEEVVTQGASLVKGIQLGLGEDR